MDEEFVKNQIIAVKKGDQQAYADLVDMYKDKVYYICYRTLGNSHDAEELAQDSFVRAYIHIEKYNMNMKFSSWLYRIATNACIDWLRKKKPDYYLDAEIAGTEGLTMYSQVAASGELPEGKLETKELQVTVQTAISRLPEKYRTIIILKYIDELSLQEISDIVSLPVGTVKTRIHRGREALRKLLGGEYDEVFRNE